MRDKRTDRPTAGEIVAYTITLMFLIVIGAILYNGVVPAYQ